MTKKLVWAVMVLVLVVGGGAYAYGSELPIFDILYSPEQQEVRQVQRLAREFPATIGAYSLYARGPEKIQIRKECPPSEGGELCYRNVTAEYRQVEGNKIVFVHVSKAANGNSEAWKALVAKRATTGLVGAYEIVRVEKHELGWFPLAKYDFILTQEGLRSVRADGLESYSYPAKATDANPVTAYFIETYPPVLASRPIGDE